MPRQTETHSRVQPSHHTATTLGRARSRRRSPWRLARSAVMVVAAGVLIGAVALTYFPKQQTAQAVLCNSCTPHAPEPGPARPWEVDIPISTYSQVNTRHGNVFTAIPIVSWSGRGPDMNMMLYHNSAAVGDTSFAQAVGFNLGPGWSISYSDHLVFNDPSKITVVADDGTKDVFTLNGTIWQPPFGVHAKLEPVVGTNLWRLTHKNQSYHEFERTSPDATIARLNQLVDSTDNALALSYISAVLGTITDAAGRGIVLSVSAGRLSQILDPLEAGQPAGSKLAERKWYPYYDEDGRLGRIRDPMSHDNAFAYDVDGRLLTVSDKKGQNVLDPGDRYFYTYGAGGRLESVTDPQGGLAQGFTYACWECPYGSGQWLRRDLYTTYTDRRGNSWQYKFWDDRYTLVPTAYLQEVTNPLNGKRAFGFGVNRNLLYFCDRPEGAYNCWGSTYDSNGNRLTLTDPFNHVQSWTYDTVNNVVTSYTDAAGNFTQFKYEVAGFPTLLSRIIECPVALDPGVTECPLSSDPPTTRMTYYLGATDNGLGQLTEVIDPNGVRTGFQYDQWGQLSHYAEGQLDAQTASPSDVYYMDVQTDSGGRDVTMSDSGGSGGSSTHDANNNPTGSSCGLPGAVAGGSVVPPDGFPRLPCMPAALPTVEAGFQDADYSPKGELTRLEMDLTVDPPGLNNTQYYTRTHTAMFDALGRQTDGVVTSNEYGAEIPRPFTYDHDWAYGTYTRTGPDNVQTFVQLDTANRVQFIRRGPAAAPLMAATYTYLGNDLVQSVTYGNDPDGPGPYTGASVHYTYDAARRVTQIEHRDSFGNAMLWLEYTYLANDLPGSIDEWGSGGDPITGKIATTTFSYDKRRRLIGEVRNAFDSASGYDLSYVYDKGGNRTLKIDNSDPSNPRQVVYHYDVDADVNPPQASNPYGSFNNRLMWSETLGAGGATLFRSWYYYTAAGNVDRVVTHEEPTGGVVAMSVSVGGELGTMGEASAALMAPPGECLNTYTATRFGYAKNGKTVTYALGEQWCSDGDPANCPTEYTVTYAREFRYDGARARYMNAPLNPATMNPYNTTQNPTVWSDYDADEVYGDFEMVSGSPVNKRSFEPGIARTENPLTTPVTSFSHGDMIGTTRLMSNSSGSSIEPAVYTAFGERITGPATADSTRYGYAGAWGYQSHTEFPYLHVGARYYDPSSGRFLQRDPIGIEGDQNIFEYLESSPTVGVDPDGLSPLNRGKLRVGPSRVQVGGRRWVTRIALRYRNYHLYGLRAVGATGGLVVGAAGVGYGTGTLIDYGVERVTGTSLSDRLGNWMFATCPSWFSW